MKTLKILSLAIFTLMISSCSKNDDTVVVEEVAQLTTQDLLQSGVWYIESKSGEVTDDCLTQSYVKFVDEDTMINEFFETIGGVCEWKGLDVHQYNRIDNVITISTSGDPVILTIMAISKTELTLYVEEGSATNYTIYFIK